MVPRMVRTGDPSSAGSCAAPGAGEVAPKSTAAARAAARRAGAIRLPRGLRLPWGLRLPLPPPRLLAASVNVNMPADVGYAQGHMQCTQRKLSSDEYAYDQSTKVSDVLGSCAVLIHILPASLGSDCTVLRIRYREPRGRSLLLPCRHGRCHKTREGSGENGTNDQTEQSKVQTSLAVCMLLCIQQIVGVLRSYAERSPNFGASCMRKMHTL